MSPPPTGVAGGRLLIFIDQRYWRAGSALTTDESFLMFLYSLATSFDRLVFAGRVEPRPGRAAYPLPSRPGFEFVEIPYYRSQHALGSLLASIFRGWGTAWRAVRGASAVLLGVPNVWAVILWGMSAWSGRPVILMVRQDIASRVALRPPGLRRLATLWATRLLETSMVRLARRTLVFTVGRAMHGRYARAGNRVEPLLVSLVREADLRSSPRRLPVAGSTLRLTCVGRLHPDKGLDHLFLALRGLARMDPPPTLDLVGDGPLEPELRLRAQNLGIGERVAFHGYIPHGPALREKYEQGTLFVLPSETEGFPQVLTEAMASGLPVVATAVGGIPHELEDGVDALLAPPCDPAALESAIHRVLSDPELYERLSARGLEFARRHSLEAESRRMIQCIQEHLKGPRGHR